ncbi:unnamed protein product [Caenorhabditis bovis]|uniref:Nonsense-mediated mRNA decay factor SMG8 n=1 Tax=Caenorhabditis bovis TaxID=2654633 RepID=A0A8S1F4N7_9PELO|nr:unnamed protein product [Caenorhabditis bovis]
MDENYPAPDILEWLESAKERCKFDMDTQIKIVGMIGKEYIDHGKAENINNFIEDNVFLECQSNETLSIRVHYSRKHQILFLLMNGIDDMANLRKVFIEDPNRHKKSYFECLRESNDKQIRMMAFMFSVCHYIIISEDTSRLDLELYRFLKDVSDYREKIAPDLEECLVEAKLKNTWFTTRSISSKEREGRLVVPRVLVVFHRNNVRMELGAVKKREIYEKLEKSLDTQLSDLFRNFGLTENKASRYSLFHINENLPFVHLLNPHMVQRDVLQEMLEYYTQDPAKRDFPQLATSNSFVKFLEENLRSERNVAILENVIEGMEALKGILTESNFHMISGLDMFNKHLKFEKRLMHEIVNRAVGYYQWSTLSQKKRVFQLSSREVVRTKTEHDAKVVEAIKYVKCAIGSNVDKAIEKTLEGCDNLWQKDLRACEQRSLTGYFCVKKVHPCIEDATSAPNTWTPHDSTETLLSTCACGAKQGLRKDPFSVREANFEFYENNVFDCCRNLERHQFKIYHEETEDLDEWGSWAERASNSLQEQRALESMDSADEGHLYDEIIEDRMNSSEDEEAHASQSLPEDHHLSYDSDEYCTETFASTRRYGFDFDTEFPKRVIALKVAGKSEEFVEGVPNSLEIGKLPLFPSFILTCIGDSSIYNHSSGIRDQPNFKIGGEYLTSLTIYLDGANANNQESSRRKNLDNILHSDLPLRRGCTCRKAPLKSAQLMKIHVVTPKAPVTVTIQPQIMVPGLEEIFMTGESPLQLSHSRYYILQLPFIYSGPSGTYVHEPGNLEPTGCWKGGAFGVVYKPSSSSWW